MTTAAEDTVNLLSDVAQIEDSGEFSDPSPRKEQPSPGKGQQLTPGKGQQLTPGKGQQPSPGKEHDQYSPGKGQTGGTTPNPDGTTSAETREGIECHGDNPSPQPDGSDRATLRSPKGQAAGITDPKGSPAKGDDAHGQPSSSPGQPGNEGGDGRTGVEADVDNEARATLSWQSKDPATAATIASRLYYWHRTTPKRRAFVFVTEGQKGKAASSVVTCTRLYSLAVRCAHYLATTFSIRPRDVVCNTLPNSLERLVVDLGVILAGGVMLDAPRHADTDEAIVEFCNYLAPLSVKVVVCARTDPFSTTIIRKAPQAASQLCWVYFSRDCKDGGDLIAMLTKDSAPTLVEAERSLSDMGQDDRAVMWTTRGLSSQPRVIVQDHRSVLEVGLQFQKHLLELKKRDVYFCSADLGGVYGYPGVYLQTGVTTLLEDKTPFPSCWDLGHDESTRLRPLLAFDTLLAHSCTKALFTTHHLERYWDCQAIHTNGDRKLKRVAISGDSVKSMLVQQLHDNVAKEVTVAYCTAELGVVAYSQQPKKPFKEADLLTIVDTVTIQPRSVPEGDLVPAGKAGTLDITSDRKRLQLFVDTLPDSNGDAFVLRETDVVHTSDFGVVCEGKLKLAGKIDRDALLPEKPSFIRERTEFNLRQMDVVSDAVVLVYDDPEKSQYTLVACLTVEPNLTGDTPYVPDSARYLCEQHMEQMRCWKPEEYWIFGVFPKNPSGFVDRAQVRAVVDRARQQRLPFDWHYQQRQGALGQAIKKPASTWSCCSIL